MSRPRKPRKPVASCDVTKQRQRNVTIRMQMADEVAKHRAKLIDLTDLERDIHLSAATTEVQAASLLRIIHQRAEEMRRHKIATDRLTRLFR